MSGLAAILAFSMSAFCALAQGAGPDPRAIQITPGGMRPGVAEGRFALVIGNGAYRDVPLKNPPRDAMAMAEALKQCGFQVQVLVEGTLPRMETALRVFGQNLKSGGVGLFFYAGHGMQVKGANYLIPVDADIADEDEVRFKAMDANAVLAKMESAGNGLNLMVLDACRNNPFGHGWLRGGTSGLAQMDAPTGTYIAFATAPGRTASDGSGGNGLYTQHLLEALRQPGLKVEEVFKRVRVGVKQASRDLQVPWDSSSLTGEFYFRPGGAAPPAPDPASLEQVYWNSIKDSHARVDFSAFLDRYPSGTFADLARRRLLALGPDPSVPAAGTAPPPGAQSLKGHLQVAVSGAEARILLDGEFKGLARPDAPLNLPGLLTGEAKLLVEAPGCLPVSQTVTIEEGKWSQVALKLRRALEILVYRKPSKLLFNGTDYDVAIDDRKWAKLQGRQFVRFKIPMGPVTLEVSHKGPAIGMPQGIGSAALRLEELPRDARFFRFTSDWKAGLPVLEEVDEAVWKQDSVQFASQQVSPMP